MEAIISQRCSKYGARLSLPPGDPCRGVEAVPSGISANGQVGALGVPWDGRLLQKVDSRELCRCVYASVYNQCEKNLFNVQIPSFLNCSVHQLEQLFHLTSPD